MQTNIYRLESVFVWNAADDEELLSTLCFFSSSWRRPAERSWIHAASPAEILSSCWIYMLSFQSLQRLLIKHYNCLISQVFKENKGLKPAFDWKSCDEVTPVTFDLLASCTRSRTWSTDADRSVSSSVWLKKRRCLPAENHVWFLLLWGRFTAQQIWIMIFKFRRNMERFLNAAAARTSCEHGEVPPTGPGGRMERTRDCW